MHQPSSFCKHLLTGRMTNGQHKAEKRGAQKHQEGGGCCTKEEKNRTPSKVYADCFGKTGIEGGQAETESAETHYCCLTRCFSSEAFFAAKPA